MATAMTTTTALRKREEKAIAPSNSRTPQQTHIVYILVSLRFGCSPFSPTAQNRLDILTLL
ncbi:hypothetical protein U1Q18_052150, partial [Sarracenia purpurea var. burkii]